MPTFSFTRRDDDTNEFESECIIVKTGHATITISGVTANTSDYNDAVTALEEGHDVHTLWLNEKYTLEKRADSDSWFLVHDLGDEGHFSLRFSLEVAELFLGCVKLAVAENEN
jgi:hypothetical protein